MSAAGLNCMGFWISLANWVVPLPCTSSSECACVSPAVPSWAAAFPKELRLFVLDVTICPGCGCPALLGAGALLSPAGPHHQCLRAPECQKFTEACGEMREMPAALFVLCYLT